MNSWKDAMRANPADCGETCWIAWVYVHSNTPGLHGWDCIALCATERSDVLRFALDFVRESRPYLLGVKVWRAPRDGSRRMLDRAEVRRRKGETLDELAARVACL